MRLSWRSKISIKQIALSNCVPVVLSLKSIRLSDFSVSTLDCRNLSLSLYDWLIDFQHISRYWLYFHINFVIFYFFIFIYITHEPGGF